MHRVIEAIPEDLLKQSSDLPRLACLLAYAYLFTYASKQASHEASFLSSKQVVEVLLACWLGRLKVWVGRGGEAARRRGGEASRS